MSAAPARSPLRELARRTGGGIEVALYWRPADNTTSIEVRESSSGERLAFIVSAEHALDAFYHPFAHLPTAVGGSPAARRAGARS
jgi:hypothetical protein